MDSIPCNIVLLPSDDIAAKAIRLSNNLDQFDRIFTLEDGRFYPHVTLYMTQLKRADLDKAAKLLSTVADRTSPLELVAYRYFQVMGYFDVEYQRVSGLDQLQEDVIRAINPIRDGLRDKDKPRLAAATGKQREYFEAFGFPSIREFYRPHLTLTRFNSEDPVDRTGLPRLSEFDDTFASLGIFEMGDNGTCARKIAEYDFGHVTPA